jgi:hypothetical protein
MPSKTSGQLEGPVRIGLHATADSALLLLG